MLALECSVETLDVSEFEEGATEFSDSAAGEAHARTGLDVPHHRLADTLQRLG
jgi:hypothetical protein